MSLPNKKVINFFIKLLVSLAFVAWLIFRVNWKEVIFYMQKISFLDIILYMAVLLIGMFISAYKWKILIKFKGYHISVWNCFCLYITGSLINNFFPSVLGGDTYRTYKIGRTTEDYAASAASVIMDRISGLIGIMVLTVIFSAFNWQVISKNDYLVAINGAILLSLLAIPMFFKLVKSRIWISLSSHIPEKLDRIIRDFIEYTDPGIFFKSVLLSVLYGLVGVAAINLILFHSLGIDISFLNYLSVIFIISIVVVLPISINNIGVKEWAYITFFGFFGVASSAVVTVALVSRILQMLISFAALPAYLKNK